MTAAAGKVMFYIQHLLGIGHIKRAATLARGLIDGGFEVTLVSGGMPVPGLNIGSAAMVQLPPTRATDVFFKELVDATDQRIDDAWKTARKQKLAAAFDHIAPDILITELFPFGRRQLSFELIPLLERARARAPRPLIVSSVRDILVESPKPERTAEMVERVVGYYDLVLVHGDPGLIPFEQTFPHAGDIANQLEYTGYVVDRDPQLASPPGPPEVLVSAGGGAVSEPLLRAALEARGRSVLAQCPWRFLVGHNLPARQFETFAATRPAGVIIERARPDFTSLLKRCVLSISQGGYNTVMEVLDAGARAVVVPYAGGLETEQTLRARLLAGRGVLEVVDEAELSAESVARAVDRAIAAPQATLDTLDTGGVETSARLLAERLAALRAP